MREYLSEEPPAIIVQKCLDASDGELVKDTIALLQQKCLGSAQQ